MKLFTKHPHSVGESYVEHLKFASLQGSRLAWAGIACVIHSIFPFLFVTTASDIVKKFNREVLERGNKEL